MSRYGRWGLTGLEGEWSPKGIRTAGDGHWIVQLERNDWQDRGRRVVDRNPFTGTQLFWGGHLEHSVPGGLGVSDDRSTVVVSGQCTRSYYAATGTIGDCWAVGAHPPVEGDGPGDRFTDGKRIFSRDGVAQGSARARFGAELSPDGSTLYAAGEKGIWIFDVSQNPSVPLLLLDIPLVVERLRLTADGSILYGWSEGFETEGDIIRIVLP